MGHQGWTSLFSTGFLLGASHILVANPAESSLTSEVGSASAEAANLAESSLTSEVGSASAEAASMVEASTADAIDDLTRGDTSELDATAPSDTDSSVSPDDVVDLTSPIATETPVFAGAEDAALISGSSGETPGGTGSSEGIEPPAPGRSVPTGAGDLASSSESTTKDSGLEGGPASAEKEGEESVTALSRKLGDLESRLATLETAEKARREHNFVKGWLAGVGDINFVSDNHEFVIGMQIFPEQTSGSDGTYTRSYFLGAVPRVALHFGGLYMGFEVPLTFRLFASERSASNDAIVGGDGFKAFSKSPTLEWDEPSEYAQVINYIRYGRKEDDLYLNVSQGFAATLGHGTQLRRYNPNIDFDHSHVSAQYDQSFHYGGIEIYTNDIVKYDVNGALAYVKPGRIVGLEHPILRTTSIGVSYLFDRSAPYRLVHDEANPTYLVADEQSRAQVDAYEVASVFGLDAEMKVFKGEKVDVKVYSDYSRLLNTDAGGLTVGGLMRLNLVGNNEKERVHAFRVRAEGGVYHNRYAPGYFDTFYEIEKYHALFGESDARPMSKLEYLEAEDDGARMGGRVEATYKLVDGIGISAGAQSSKGGRDSQVLLHLEVPTGEHLRFIATYARLNLDQPGNGNPINDPNTLLIGKAKLRVLPILFLNAELSQNYHLKAVSEDGESALGEPYLGSAVEFRNIFRWVLETEIGFEF